MKRKYKMRTFKVVCGGETPEARHSRVQSDIMSNEQKRQNAERFADPTILTGSAEEQVKELLFAVKTYEQDLAMYRKYTKELEQKIKQLEASISCI
jgi:hypothetical protein